MIRLDYRPHQTFTPKQAEIIADLLNNEDDWEYRVVHDPSGKGNSHIEIYDEDGEFVSRF